MQEAPAGADAASASAPLSPTNASAAGAGSGRRPRRARSSGREAKPAGKRPGFFKQLAQGYGELVNAIIRPPRAEYQEADLGPATFTVAGRHYQRTDVKVRNAKGLLLECSWWEPVDGQRIAQELPCVVYMHGNSSCRLEALELLPLVLQTGCMLFAFDFAGCGLSEGDHITLGYKEKDDAREVIDFLRASGKVSTVALWGRSMGAATALLHGHRDPSIAAMVLDSPFSSLERLAKEVIDQAQIKHKPDLLVRAFMRMMRNTIVKRSGLDILKLRPIENVDTCFIPALFVAGSGDQFIPPSHATDICDKYAGDKNILLVEGNHNSRRPGYFLDSVSIFLHARLCVPAGLTEEVLGLSGPRPGMGSTSPTAFWRRQQHGRDVARSALGYAPSAAGVHGGDSAGLGEHEQQELQEALLASLAGVGSPGGGASSDSPGAAAGRLVARATSQTQSTMPNRRTAALAISTE